MSGNNVVLDSDVIIFASKGLIDIDELVSRYDRLYVSIISFMEVYAFDFVNFDERVLIDKVFMNLEIVDVGMEIAKHAIAYRSNKLKKIKLPDATILATVKHIKATLLTNNLSDFLGIDESVEVLGIEDLRFST